MSEQQQQGKRGDRSFVEMAARKAKETVEDVADTVHTVARDVVRTGSDVVGTAFPSISTADGSDEPVPMPGPPGDTLTTEACDMLMSFVGPSSPVGAQSFTDNIESQMAASGVARDDVRSRRLFVEARAAVAAAVSGEDLTSLHRVLAHYNARAADASKVPRFILLVLLFVQSLLLLIACIISGNHRETIPENVRTFCLLLALLCTALSFNPMAPHHKLREKARMTGAIKCLSLVFEMQLFSVAEDWPTLFIFGAIVIVMTILIFVLLWVSHWMMHAWDLDDTEMFYSVHAAGTKETEQLADVIIPEVVREAQERTGDGEQPSFEALLAAARAEIARRLKYGGATDIDAATRYEDGTNADANEEFDVAAVLKKVKDAPERLNHTAHDSRLNPASLRNWFVAYRVRNVIYERDRDGVSILTTVLVLCFAFAIGNVVYEFTKIFANQPPLFSDSLNRNYRTESPIKGYFGVNRSHSDWKVHVVVVDGLRYDLTESGASALGDLVNTAAFRANSVRVEMEAQIPSFSVPNWITLLSGAPPEQTGVTGNLLASESEYDHVYAECESFGVHAGLTGTPWWRDLIFSTVPTLDGDGTIWASYVPPNTPEYSWLTSNPADEARLAVALTAARRSTYVAPFEGSGAPQLYQFFLSHFSDVDKQGHEYGIDTKWNPDNTYMRAIENKTAAIQQIINAIDNQTILVITSDHGHVKRGGHGGVSGVLKRVPAIFYTKNFTWTAGTRTAFSGLRPGTYENTDFAATITALLGIPAPRQTTGVFMEEIVRALVPSNVLDQHYYDLFRARYSLVQQMNERVGADLWGNRTQGSVLESEVVQRVYSSNGVGITEAQYGEAITLLDEEYTASRDFMFNVDFYRNLLCSIAMVFPVVFIMLVVVDRYTIASLSSITDGRYVAQHANIMACIKAFVTVFLHVLISTVSFVIGFFGVVGYSVWDSTLTHTPSVAITFLTMTVIAPVFYYIVLSRLFLLTSINWYSIETIRDLRFGRPVNHLVCLGWVANFLRDLLVFCFGTSRYRSRKFADAYLYLVYLAFWSIVAAFIMLFLCFPFSFMVPVVFATPFVTDFNAEFRFRMITMLMLVLPLLLGTALLLILLPKLQPSTLLAWNDVISRHLMHDDYMRLKIAAENHSSSDDDGHDVREGIKSLLELRMSLMQCAINAVAAPDFLFVDSTLPLAESYRSKNGGSSGSAAQIRRRG